MARAQLAAWEKIAAGWDMDGDGRCVWCGKGIILRTDREGRAYRYDDAQRLALIVLHLRNHHTDLDPDRG